MRKIVSILILVMGLLVSCEYIPDYKFSSSIPRSLLEAKYGYVIQESPKMYGFGLDLNASGAFKYSLEDESQDIGLPAEGVYTVQYDSYSVTSASGRITFTGTGTAAGEVVDALFVWTASAIEGTLSLQLSLETGTRCTLEWWRDSEL